MIFLTLSQLLVCSLNSILENLQVSEDVYGLGQTSRIVATELANLGWAKHRRKVWHYKLAPTCYLNNALDKNKYLNEQQHTLENSIRHRIS